MGGESIWAFCAFVERECEVIQVGDTDFQENDYPIFHLKTPD